MNSLQHDDPAIIYDTLSALLLDQDDTLTKDLIEAMKDKHYNIETLSIADRRAFIVFWHKLAELYHQHRGGATKETTLMKPVYTVYFPYLNFTIHKTDSMWVFLLNQCTILAEETIVKHVPIVMARSSTLLDVNEVNQNIFIMYIASYQKTTKPRLWMWKEDNEIRSKLTDMFFGAYQRLRIIALCIRNQAWNTRIESRGLSNFKDDDLGTMKSESLALLKIIHLHGITGMEWIQIIKNRAESLLHLTQNELLRRLGTSGEEGEEQTLRARFKSTPLLFQGVKESFDATITGNSIAWDWDVNNAADMFQRGMNGLDAKNWLEDLPFRLKPEHVETTERLRRVRDVADKLSQLAISS